MVVTIKGRSFAIRKRTQKSPVRVHAKDGAILNLRLLYTKEINPTLLLRLSLNLLPDLLPLNQYQTMIKIQ